MKKIGICGIYSQNDNYINNALNRYKENITLNTIINITHSNLKQPMNDIVKLGLYDSIDDVFKICAKKKINTVYITSKNIPKDFRANTNGIDAMYF